MDKNSSSKWFKIHMLDSTQCEALQIGIATRLPQLLDHQRSSLVLVRSQRPFAWPANVAYPQYCLHKLWKEQLKNFAKSRFLHADSQPSQLNEWIERHPIPIALKRSSNMRRFSN